MAAISAKDVAALRERTGVGMMDCKKALVEADGDMDKAIVILREKGLATQASKAGRIAAEGLVSAIVKNGVGAVAEVNSETDFVAQNDEFRSFVSNVTKTVIKTNPANLEALNAAVIEDGSITVEEALQELFLKIRENMKVRRFKRMEGIVVPYVHGGGTIGVLVNLESDIDSGNDKLLECGKNVALQVAAMNARFLSRADVPADVIEEEKKIMMSQMAEDPKMASKPEQVREKIVDGKIVKFYSDNCLLEQAYVKDSEMTVQKYIDSVAKELGGSVKVKEYIRFEKGEGIEKKQDDFAAEVANMAGGNK